MLAEPEQGSVGCEGQRIAEAICGPLDRGVGGAADLRLKADWLPRQDLAGRGGEGSGTQKKKTGKAHKLFRRGVVRYRFQFK